VTYTTNERTVYMPPGLRLTDRPVKTNTGIHTTATTAYQYDKDGKYVNAFNSLSLAAKAVGGKSPGGISHAITKKTKCKGFYWSHEKKENYFD